MVFRRQLSNTMTESDLTYNPSDGLDTKCSGAMVPDLQQV